MRTWKPAAVLEDELIARTKAAWQAWADNDSEAYRDRLTEDAVFVVAGDSITAGRDAIMANISSHDREIENLEFADFKLRQLSPEIAILTYTATSEPTCEGQSLPSSVYSMTVYVRQDASSGQLAIRKRHSSSRKSPRHMAGAQFLTGVA